MAASSVNGICEKSQKQLSSRSNSSIQKSHQDLKDKDENSENVQERLALDEIQQSHRCKSWIQQQLIDSSTHLKKCRLVQEEALVPSSPDEDDISILNDRISKLQEDLLTWSSNKSFPKVMLERLLEGEHLIKLLFPDTATESPTLERVSNVNDIAELCEKNNELCSFILEYHQELSKTQTELDEVRQRNFEIKVENRELMKKLQILKESKNSCMLLSSEEHVTEANKRYQYAQSKLHLTANIFQALVVGSGINWAANDSTRKLVISLGEIN